MQIIDLILIGLATWQAIEIYWHSPLFAEARAKAEEGSDEVSQVLQCPWCLSVWVAGIIALWVMLTPTLLHIPVWALAASRLANILNDLTHSFNRTPRDDSKGPG